MNAISAPLVRYGRPLLEIAGLIGLLVALDAVFGGGGFAAFAVHPFWAVVLLFAAQYGVGGGVAAAIACGLVFATAAGPAPAGLDFYAGLQRLLALPSAWFAAALIFGGLRSLHLARLAEAERRREDAEAAAAELAAGLDTAVAEIAALERRIAGDAATVGAALAGFAGLDRSGCPAAFAASAAPLAADLAGAAAGGLYAVSGDVLTLLAAWDEDGGALKDRSGPVGAAVAGAVAAAPIGAHAMLLVERLRAGAALDAALPRARALGAALAPIWPAAAERSQAGLAA